MAKEWLDFQTDQKPFFYRPEAVEDIFEKIRVKKEGIEKYFEVHPKSRDIICTQEKRMKRCLESANSYLGLEDDVHIDIVPSAEKSEIEKEIEMENMKRIAAYQRACEDMHQRAINPNEFLYPDLLVMQHIQMCMGDSEKRGIIRHRFRNETDPEIIIGQGYFAPVEGELVSARVNYLFSMLNNDWYEDHPIVKGAKFVTEYVRIQPHLDGNKRVALMALNFILEEEGYPDIYFDNKQKDALFNAIKTSMLTRDVTEFAQLIAENVRRRCNDRIVDIRDYRIKNFQEENNL